MILVRGVSFRRQQRMVLRELSFEVRRGELFAILGRNGAGKSTLLHLLSGDLRPSSGAIHYEGRDLSAWSRATLACRRAVLMQALVVSLPFTVRDIVMLGHLPHVARETARRGSERVANAMEQLGIGDLADRRYHTLSGGEQQRVQLARCLVQTVGATERPGLMLLDEPVAHLDPGYQHILLAATRAFTRAGGTAIIVLHDLNLASAYADRALLLADNTVAACGPPSAILDPALITKLFGVHTISLHCETLAHPVLAFAPDPVGTPLDSTYPSSGEFHGSI